MTSSSGNDSEWINPNGLEAFLLQRGYSLCRKNGQRISCSQLMAEDSVRGCEVFVGKLPHDATEEELLPYFEKVGEIRCLRLMVDYKGQNRGFGFVTYGTVAVALQAVRELNRSFLRPHKRIAVVWSVDNRRLFLGGLPPTAVAADIREEVSKRVANIENVILYPCADDPNRNRGFAFIEFRNHMYGFQFLSLPLLDFLRRSLHQQSRSISFSESASVLTISSLSHPRSAAIARKHLQNCEKGSLFKNLPKPTTSANCNIQVDWASPEPQIDPDQMAKVTNLFVRNVSVDTTEAELMKMFSFDGQLEVVRVRRPSNFAFIHFTLREHAEQAMQRLNGFESHGLKLEIEWAKPAPRTRNDHVHDGYRSRPARGQRLRGRPAFWSPQHQSRFHYNAAPGHSIITPHGNDVSTHHSPMINAPSYYELLNNLSYQMFGEPARFTVLTYPTERQRKFFYVYVTLGNHTEVFDRLYENRQVAIEAAAASCCAKLQIAMYNTNGVSGSSDVTCAVVGCFRFDAEDQSSRFRNIRTKLSESSQMKIFPASCHQLVRVIDPAVVEDCPREK